jgi:hypothetical protein
MAQPKKKSLQDVLRQRRAAAPLLSARELREREAARRREEVEREAARLVARWRAERTVVDADGKLGQAVYGAVFGSSRPAYQASKHWSRRSLAQRKAMPACEVARCGRSEGLHAHLLNYDALGEEVAGRDLITLCEGCLRRAVKLEQDRGRPATRAELRALDPDEPLYDADAIAALKAKHSRPLGP